MKIVKNSQNLEKYGNEKESARFDKFLGQNNAIIGHDNLTKIDIEQHNDARNMGDFSQTSIP